MESMHETHVWACLELRVEAAHAYNNPYRDVTLHAEFRGPDNQLLLVPGFWDGDNVWKIRFAPITTGTWTWRTRCSALDDHGLHDRSGMIVAAPWSPAEIDQNPNRRGFVQVHLSGRFFTYADGTPFLWLGDTLWAGHRIGCNGSDLAVYLQDRQRKGFTVIQILAAQVSGEEGAERNNSYFDPAPGDFVNEGGAAYTHRYDRINPRYFQYLDTRLQMMLDAGLVPCLFGVWGKDLGRMGVANLAEYWRYLIARYAAYNVLWSVAGEYFFTPDEQGWRKVGQMIDATDPYAHPTSLHSTAPHSGSRHYQRDHWYDFNLIQVGHAYGLRHFVETLPLSDYRMEPTKPSIMSESWYEHHATTLGEGDQRFDDRDIRFVSYVPLLQGCVGQTYGAHGIWSWAGERDAHSDTFNHPFHWRDDLDLPGSAQMRHLRSLMDQIKWWALEPHPEIVSATAPINVYCGAVPGREYVVYATGGDGLVMVFLPPGDYWGRWFDPRTGAWRDAEGVGQWYGSFWRWTARPPDDQDWILVVRVVE
jgi:hypothetical protein